MRLVIAAFLVAVGVGYALRGSLPALASSAASVSYTGALMPVPSGDDEEPGSAR